MQTFSFSILSFDNPFEWQMIKTFFKGTNKDEDNSLKYHKIRMNLKCLRTRRERKKQQRKKFDAFTILTIERAVVVTATQMVI